ncbi:RHS repeat domain-containing protein [Pseudomonas proteolytica]|uniref:RHS repeat domain-containing protein n=1 Tax=Pseudomonas proteolytica TaxID=219574 RepID=UPI001473CC14|nr:RHS repeat-associated core domain-containing protein [Pseudomonas proteolytica]NMZ33478.1 hypothetical protein [Pseudomonas proteolytica]
MARNPMGTDPTDDENDPIFNATTQKRNVVDPRTGLFEVYVPLPSVIGNDGNGPVIEMGLHNTPVVNNEAALGDGWFYCMTTYSEHHKKLTLHSGEVVAMEKGESLFQPAVIVLWHADRFRVFRKDGRKEILAQVGNTGIYMPVSLTTDGYNSLTLSWTSTPHVIDGKTYYQIQLTEIRDATRSLLKVQYTPGDPDAATVISAANLTFWPDDPTETLNYALSIENYALKSVSLDATIQSSFEYQDDPACGWLLTKITSFDGLQEQVQYEDNGLTFPDNPKLSALPCVSTHTLTPNGGGTPVITRYVYERQNKDNYRTIVREGDPVIRTTTYNYNKNHDVTSQVLVQGGATTETKYTTLLTDGLLSRNISKTYIKASKRREEKNENRFNKDSALLKNRQKRTTTSLGYILSPALAGPVPETLGERTLLSLLEMIRNASNQQTNNPLDQSWTPTGIESKNLFSSTTLNTEIVDNPGLLAIIPELVPELIPTLRNISKFNFHTYKKIDTQGELKVTSTLQGSLAGEGVSSAALIGQRIEYFENNDFRKGRVKTLTRSTLGTRDRRPIASDPLRTFDYALGGAGNTELTTTTTDTDATGKTRTTSQTQSTLSGRLVRQVDADGNRTEFAYNSYGQLVTLTVCAQTATYRQVTTYAYPAPGQIKITEPNGQTRLSQYDGQDQLVSEHLLQGSQSKQTKAVTYDSLGRELRRSAFDYDAAGGQLVQWQEAQYDDWNEVSSQRYSDGRQTFNVYDPIALTRAQWTGKATDKHAMVTSYNVDDTVKKIEWKDQAGLVYQTHAFTYTQSKQVKQLKIDNEFGFTTLDYTYDGAGRLLSEKHSEKGRGLLDIPFVYTYHYTYPVHWLLQDATQIEIETGGKRQILGKRSIDSWGRVTSLTRGSHTETFTYNGTSQVPATTLTADGQALKHDYIKELGNRLAKTSTADASAHTSFAYAYGTQGVATASEGDRLLQYDHDLYLRVSRQHVQTAPGQSKDLLYTHSLGSRLLNSTDALGNQTLFFYSPTGQRYAANNFHFTTSHSYDDQGRFNEEIIAGPYNLAPASPVAFNVKYTHDSQQRETRRHFTVTGKVDLLLENTYYADDKLKSVQLKQGATVLGSRSLTYNPGGRLKSCTTTGAWRPKTPSNKDIDKQEFTYDALGNVLTCVTTFGTAKNTATYTYDAVNGYRLTRVVNTHGDYTASANLSYDAAGRLTQDQTGKTYSYDWLGRLIRAGSTHYRYDPANRLMTRDEGTDPQQVIYDGLKACGDYSLGTNASSRNLNPGSTACTVQRIKRSGVERTMFELRDMSGSVLVSYDAQAQTLKHHAYTAYGEHFCDEPDSLLGFNGEYRDVQYPLGMGARWYDAASMRFNAPDELSPFGKGGPNLYAYCAEGDPVNFQDPTGHFSVDSQLREIWGDSLPGPVGFNPEQGALVHTLLWGGIGVLTAVMTGGTSLLMTAALVGLAASSLVTGIASLIVRDTAPEASSILAWVSLGTGALGGLVTVAGKTAQLTAYLGRSFPAAARNLISKASKALISPLKQSSLGRGFERFWAKALPNPAVSMNLPYSELSLTSSQGLSGLFDLGDVNTLSFVTSGVLGNLGLLESEPAQLADTFVGDITWLPFGSWGGLWLTIRGR